MPLPTTLNTIDFAWRGQPFVYVPAKSSIALATLDFAYRGRPFYGQPLPSVATGFKAYYARGSNSVINAGIAR